MKIQRTGVYLFLLPFVLIIAAWGQTTGTLSGTVNDAAGAPVANATVTVTPTAGGAGQKALTGQDGKFSIAGLPSGAYTVDVEYAGYKKTSVQNIDLTSGGPSAIKVELQHGDTRETVELEGSAVLTHADSAQMANAIDSRTVTEVPLLDRNHQQLVDLLPGITPPQTIQQIPADPQQSRHWETNGLSDTANRRSLDGVENDEPFNGGSAYVTPLHGVAQMNVLTSNYDARFGRAGGAIINPVTRAGTNDIHGSLFEFNANSALAARNFFDPKGFPQAHSNINQTGASIGGPIHRDSTFFFADFEGDFNRSFTPTLATVPTDAMRAGNFSGVPGLVLYNPESGPATSPGARQPFANNIIPVNRMSLPAQALLRSIPEPNAVGFEDNLIANVPFRSDGYRGDLRFDHKVGDNLNLFLRYGYASFMSSQGSVLGAIGSTDGHLQSHNVMLGGTYNLSPATTTDLRLSYNRYANKLNSSSGGLTAAAVGIADPSVGLVTGSGFTNLGLPQIQIGGMSPFGAAASYPQYDVDNNWNLVNGWNFLTGRHNIHFGFDVYYTQMNGFQNYPFGPQGGYVFGPGATASPVGSGLGPYGDFANSFAGFLLGTPTQAGRNLPNYNPAYTNWQSSLHLGDAFKLTDRLTLNLGARWDVFTPPALRHSSGGLIYNPATGQVGPSGTTGNLDTSWGNIAPRVGIAYRAMGRTVIRAGYGINFYQGPLNFYASSLLTNLGIPAGPLAGGFATFGSLNQLPALVPSTFNRPDVAVAFSPKNMRTPYVQNYDFMIEHDLGHYGLVASVGYLGNLGRELPYSLETNAALPGAAQPLAATLGRTASTAERLTGLTSNYNSLQATLNKRFSNNLSFTMAYTYSRALDYGAGGLNPLLNNINVRANYGPADWNRTNMFTFSHVWRLPFGADSHFLSEGMVGKILGPWQIDGLFHWVSGTPFTITADPTLCNCPGNTPLASAVVTGTTTRFIPVPTFFGFYPIPFQSLNFAYAQPAAGSFGNLGRNSVIGPGFANYDVSLFRSFVIHEQARFEFRAEAFNLANSPHFANPIGNVNSAMFGQSISTLPYNSDRRLQLAVRILF